MPSVSPKPTHANPTIYSLTTNATTTNSDAYILRVSSDSTTNVLTIASNKSHLVQNEGSNSFVLATTGNSNLTINAGGQARATWSSSTSQHELQDDQISVTVDTAMSDSSTNPVRNSVIKTYVDSATGSTTNLTWTASTRTIASSSGNDAVITEVDSSNSGLMTSADKTKVDYLTVTSSVDLDTIGTTNLTYDNSSRQVQSSTGTNATIDLASSSVDGLMASGDKTKVDYLTVTSSVDLDSIGTTNLTYDNSSRQVESSTGTNATIDLASSSVDGLMASGDKTKVDYLTVTSSVDLDTLGTTNLTYDNSSRQVQSSTGTNATIDLASSSVDGLMASGDKTKVDYLTVTSAIDLGDCVTLDGEQTLTNKSITQSQITDLERELTIYAVDFETTLTAGDGKAYFRIPIDLDGMDLVQVGAQVGIAQSTSGTPTVQLTRLRAGTAGGARSAADMLSTTITIDANEWDSKDASTSAVIDESNDDVATGDLIRVDVDSAGTGTKGLFVSLGFK